MRETGKDTEETEGKLGKLWRKNLEFGMKAFFQELFCIKPFHLLDNHMGQESSLFHCTAEQPTQDTEKLNNFSTVTQLVMYLDVEEAAPSSLRGRSLLVI